VPRPQKTAPRRGDAPLQLQSRLVTRLLAQDRFWPQHNEEDWGSAKQAAEEAVRCGALEPDFLSFFAEAKSGQMIPQTWNAPSKAR